MSRGFVPPKVGVVLGSAMGFNFEVPSMLPPAPWSSRASLRKSRSISLVDAPPLDWLPGVTIAEGTPIMPAGRRDAAEVEGLRRLRGLETPSASDSAFGPGEV